ncbi:type II secretion system protein [Kutzneria buriramensis]|uniref:General secretion pathway protein G n=1 Tax=Kutzneria buriramensis TaxID=1045776 RepID=A0A3E0GZA6_9PSEU|nr:prepilin-type N-terminal cleavage/methylation domain-containing protein [Kutzneria buriramensis]REH33136.1 general secretion pathway protein G [Kutzneria buriramensis]
MLEQIRAARENESGFTLIELLIVIVILGVLAGIVVFAVSAFNNDGVAAACKSDAKNVEVASEAYYAKTGGWANDIPTLVTANYLKQAPSTSKYTITYTKGTGTTESTVTGAINGGGSCYP